MVSLRGLLTTALCATTAVEASLSSRHQMLKHSGKSSALDKLLEKRQSQPSRKDPHAYLNSKTKPYAVNGAGLPEVDFDIGESYAGLLPIDDTGKELFFWFVPSTNPAASNEITLWLNGGPGCSSLDGFFHEMGPVIWQAGTYRPVPNTYAWNNLTNIVYVDQPIGTGYSKTGKPNATDENDIADQFLPFWKNFMDLFDLQKRDVYITGESYAGQYCPYITSAMLDHNDQDYFNVKGMMIYDPSIQYPVTSQVAAWPFVEANMYDFPFNDSFVALMNERMDTCGYNDFNAKALTFPPAGHFEDPVGIKKNGEPKKECDLFDIIFESIFALNPCFDIYQVGQLCPLLWDVLGFPYSTFYLPVGFDTPYFNRTDVKKAIHAPLDVNWEICSTGAPVFKHGNDKSPPSGHNGGPLMQVIESTNNVIVGHGALDMVLIANGTLITLNNLTWNGAQGFSQPPTNPFYVPYHNDPIAGSVAGAGVFGGWVEERGLTFVAIALSRHEVPEYQPSAGYRTLEKLLGRIDSFSEVSPFTTQPHYKQPQAPLGQGNWWPN